jgi:FMN phosphatase YigB (HAD superfamily)
MAARQWLFFDFDDVLAHRSLDRSKLVGERLGILPEQARAFYADGYKDIARFAKQAWAIRTVADEVDFYTELFTHLGGLSGRHHSHQSLADLAVEFVAVPFELYDGVIETLTKLGECFELGILSDAHATRRGAELTYLDLLSHFRVILISGEVGADKSMPLFYQDAIVAARCKASLLRLVDNDPAPLQMSLDNGFSKGVLIGQARSDEWETESSIKTLAARLLLERSQELVE